MSAARSELIGVDYVNSCVLPAVDSPREEGAWLMSQACPAPVAPLAGKMRFSSAQRAIVSGSAGVVQLSLNTRWVLPPSANVTPPELSRFECELTVSWYGRYEGAMSLDSALVLSRL